MNMSPPWTTSSPGPPPCSPADWSSCPPFYIETNLQDRMRAEVARYQAACRRLAEKHHAIFVDTQAEFDRILQSRHSSFISWDRVHPNDVGHTALAMAFLRAMEFDFEA